MTLTKFRKSPAVFSPLFDNFFENEFFNGNGASNLPSANIKELEGRFEVELAIPGFDKKDINIELNDRLLTISSEKSEEHNEEDEKAQYSRREFQYSSFTRSFRLPEKVREDDIKAQVNNGVLSVIIPKAEELKKRKSIEIS